MWIELLPIFIALTYAAFAIAEAVRPPDSAPGWVPCTAFWCSSHHSAKRVDIWGSLYFNPLDLLGFARIPEMLAGVDVSTPRTAAADRPSIEVAA